MRKLMAMLIIVSLVWNALPLLSVPLPSCSLAVWTPGHFSPLGQLCLQSYHPDHQPVISFSLFSSYTEFYLKLFGFRRPSWQWGFQLSEAISDISSTYWIVSFWPDSVGSEVPLYPLGFRGADSCGRTSTSPSFWWSEALYGQSLHFPMMYDPWLQELYSNSKNKGSAPGKNELGTCALPNISEP
jgi:hypothetical protein